MKTSLNKLFITMAVTAATSGAMVNAAEPGHIDFEGTVTNTPCGISADSLNQSVDFGQVGLANLDADGLSERRLFDIKLVNCIIPADTGNDTVKITFDGTTVSGQSKELKTDGTAGDVVVKLFTLADDEEITFGVPISEQFENGNTWMNTMQFYAVAAKSAKDDAAVSEGGFAAEATFTLDYN